MFRARLNGLSIYVNRPRVDDQEFYQRFAPCPPPLITVEFRQYLSYIAPPVYLGNYKREGGLDDVALVYARVDRINDDLG